MGQRTRMVFSPTTKVAAGLIGAGATVLALEVMETERGYRTVTNAAREVMQSEVTVQVAHKVIDFFFGKLHSMSASPISV